MCRMWRKLETYPWELLAIICGFRQARFQVITYLSGDFTSNLSVAATSAFLQSSRKCIHVKSLHFLVVATSFNAFVAEKPVSILTLLTWLALSDTLTLTRNADELAESRTIFLRKRRLSPRSSVLWSASRNGMSGLSDWYRTRNDSN